MRKYIDADKLISKIRPHYESSKAKARYAGQTGTSSDCAKWDEAVSIYESVIHIVTAHQQEQPRVDLVAELKHHLATTPKEQLEKEWKELEPWNNIGPTVQEFLYGKQPEGNLEYWLEHFGMPKENIDNCITQIAQGYGACRYLEGIQHGADAVNELAKQDQPEVDLLKAARYVYESWMGGTMDDVRRDMAELGKVLNARKED